MQEEEPTIFEEEGSALVCCIPVHGGLPASTSALHAAIVQTHLQDPERIGEPPVEEDAMQGQEECPDRFLGSIDYRFKEYIEKHYRID